MQDKIKEVIKSYKTKRNELTEFVKNNFQVACQEFFDNNPWLENFSWTQYTQYFNDGDECNFYVQSDTECISINGERVDDIDFLKEENYNRVDGKYVSSPNPNFDQSKFNTVKGISSFIQSIDDSLMKDMFGDHKEITVTKNGVSIEVYEDHD